MLFADDVSVTESTSVQGNINCFTEACIEWTLTSNIKKTGVTDQDVYNTPSISIDDYILEVVDEFPFLDSSNFYLKAILANACSDKAAKALARLGKLHGTTPCWSQTTRPWYTNLVCSTHCCTAVDLVLPQSTFLMRYPRTNPAISRQDSLQQERFKTGGNI